jgi:thiol-disulfide isomerase/thioredoxin
MILTAVAILTRADVKFDQFVAQNIPDVNLTAGLECSRSVTGHLHEITGHKPKFAPANGSAACGGSATAVHVARAPASQATLIADAQALPSLGTAPEFTETQRWFNTPAGKPLTLSSLRGRVVLVDFWTYTCINCIRTLPYLTAWDSAYRNRGLTIVGVETPEFAFEHDAGNVASAIGQFGVRYPVAQDNNMGTWNAYGNQYWPADYLIDAHGQVRYTAFGEGDYAKTETAIRALLAESGYAVAGKGHPTGVVLPSRLTTPETYLGTARGEGWLNAPKAGRNYYGGPTTAELSLDKFAYSGTWSIAEQPATAVASAGIDVEFQAKNAYLVLSSPGDRPLPVEVQLDGRPIAAKDAGADVHAGTLTVRGQRLYTLVSLARSERHHLALRFAPGISGYAFTFG